MLRDHMIFYLIFIFIFPFYLPNDEKKTFHSVILHYLEFLSETPLIFNRVKKQSGRFFLLNLHDNYGQNISLVKQS